MKNLTFKDRFANCTVYHYQVPDKMKSWKLSAFLQYMQNTLDENYHQGFMVAPDDMLQHESFRMLVNSPQKCLDAQLVFYQNGQRLDNDAVIELADAVSEVELGRTTLQPTLSINSINVKDDNRRVFIDNKNYFLPLLDSLFKFDQIKITSENGSRIRTTEQLIDKYDSLSQQNKIRTIFRFAAILYNAHFENVSKLFYSSRHRSGWQMWEIISRGFGGVCSEKTAAFRFILDILNIKYSPVFGTLSKLPDNFDSMVKRYAESSGEEALPDWILHYFLIAKIDSDEFMIDLTNGNIPLIFLSSNDLNLRLKGGYRSRMVYNVERLNLRRVSVKSADALQIVSEFQLPDLGYSYIFKQGLGLHISGKAYLGVFYDWGGQRSAEQQAHYTAQAAKLKLPRPRFINAGNLHSVPDKNLRRMMQEVLTEVRHQNQDNNYTGDFTFVLQYLTGAFWQRAQISKDVRTLIGTDFIERALNA
jgi:hypothetical protein